VVAVSAIPSTTSSEIDNETISLTGRYFLNAGSGFETYINLRGDTSFSEKLGNETILKSYEGRQYPVKYENNKLNQTIDFSCDLPHSDYDTMKNILEQTGEKWYRDYKGRWFSCNISNGTLNKKDNGAYQFNCTLIRVESEG
jgi:hypothetical protein